MRELLAFLLGLALIVSIAFLIVRGTAEVTQQREQLEMKIKDLLERDGVTLAHFIEALGAPKSVNVVTCSGTKCIRATWDLSYATRDCWKRLSVVLNEEQRSVFFAEMTDLMVIERQGRETRCAEAPK